MAHYLIKSPIHQSEIQDPAIITQIWFVQGNIHGLPYWSGDVAYEDLRAILKTHLQNVDVVYVKGSDKEKFLLKMLEGMPLDIINTEHTIDCPKFEKQPAACLNHTLLNVNTRTKCAINNSRILYSWITSLLPF